MTAEQTLREYRAVKSALMEQMSVQKSASQTHVSPVCVCFHGFIDFECYITEWKLWMLYFYTLRTFN